MPKVLEIKTRAPKVNKESINKMTYGETAAESIQMFGDEVVNANAIQSDVVTFQALVRRCLEKGKSQAEIDEIVKGRKMGAVTRIGGMVDPLQAALAKAATMNAEELQAYIKQLTAAAAGQPAITAAKPAPKPAA